MDEQPGLSDQYRRASPWPLFIAFGLALSEVGVALALAPIAVGGLLLFIGSAVGQLTEADYVASPWPLTVAIGVVCVGVGAALEYFYTVGFRGGAIAITGGLLVAGAVVGALWQREQF